MSVFKPLKAGDVFLLPTYKISDVYRYLYIAAKPTADAFKEYVINVLKNTFGSKAAELADKIMNTDIVVDEAIKGLRNITGQFYIHAELYVGYGWTLAGWMNGVKLVAYPLSVFSRFSVFRSEEVDPQKIIEAFPKHWNKPYDDFSLGVNSAIEALSGLFNFITKLQRFLGLGVHTAMFDLEGYMEDVLSLLYNNPNAYICSEVIARVYASAGYKYWDHLEYVSPQDIADHPKFKVIIENKLAK